MRSRAGRWSWTRLTPEEITSTEGGGAGPASPQKRSRAGRWSWTRLTPEQITSREVELDPPHPRSGDHEQGGGAGPSPQKRSRALREVELDPPHPRRDHEQGGRAGLRKLDFFRFRLFLNSGATDIVFVTLPKHGS